MRWDIQIAEVRYGTEASKALAKDGPLGVGQTVGESRADMLAVAHDAVCTEMSQISSSGVVVGER